MWQEYFLFLAKVATVVVAVLLLFGLIGASIAQARADQSTRKPALRIRKINQEITDRAESIRAVINQSPTGTWHKLQEQLRNKWPGKKATPAEQKQTDPSSAEQPSQKTSADSNDHPSEPADTEPAMQAQSSEQPAVEPVEASEPLDETERDRVFVLRFAGDIRASAVESLREEITAVLQVARPERDRVLLVLDSPGGVVPGYGLAAAQLTRLRRAQIHLTVVVDRVAASGGYMMAAVANRIVAAPFAIVGSIGVVAQLPNINKLLKRHDVDIELHTAGEYKRTLTFLGENTDEGREKFKQDLEQTHSLFKQFLSRYRPGLDMEKVATGEHWLGEEAMALNLVDAIATSDDLLLTEIDQADVYELTQPSKKRGLISKINAAAQSWLSTWHKA